MKPFKTRKVWIGIAMVLVLGIAASHAHERWERNKEKAMSEVLFKPEQPNSFCFGRLMLDLPKHALVIGTLTEHPEVDKVEMQSSITKEVFDRHVLEFETQLRTTKHKVDPSLLKAALSVPGVPDARIFVHWEDDYQDSSVMLTGFRWFPDNTQFKFTSTSAVESRQLATEFMLSVIKQFRPRAANEVPPEHGFCVVGGFFPDQQTGKWSEQSNLALNFGNWADSSISIESYVVHKREEDPLLERMSKMRAHFMQVPGFMTTLRSGNRAVGPHEGEETLIEWNKGGQKTYDFFWEVRGLPNRNDLPSMAVQMRFGQYQDGRPLLNREQMLALWEYVLDHLRVRPTMNTLTIQAKSPQAKLGTLCGTGEVCPQSGLWRAAEGGQVAGGNRKHFSAGETMPDVILLGPQTLWQKFKSERPQFRTTTVWTLVGHDTADIQLAGDPDVALPK